jgi:hypothetical protein
MWPRAGFDAAAKRNISDPAGNITLIIQLSASQFIVWVIPSASVTLSNFFFWGGGRGSDRGLILSGGMCPTPLEHCHDRNCATWLQRFTFLLFSLLTSDAPFYRGDIHNCFTKVRLYSTSFYDRTIVMCIGDHLTCHILWLLGYRSLFLYFIK